MTRYAAELGRGESPLSAVRHIHLVIYCDLTAVAYNKSSSFFLSADV